MEYNFDIIVAGCSTNCCHCYVDGGPEQPVVLADFRLCLEKLAPVLEALGEAASVTLDNEPANHPDVLEIIRMTCDLIPGHYYHHGSTTGLPLLRRADRENVAKAMLHAGWTEVSLTLHGGREHHNALVRNPMAFDGLQDAAAFYAGRDFQVGISLMLNRHLIEDREEVTRLLEQTPHSSTYFAVTSYVPTRRLREFQPLRATLSLCESLKGYLTAWGLNETELLTRFRQYSEQAVWDRLQTGFDCRALERESPETVFLTVDQALNLYYGNTGARTARLGNLHTMTSREILEAVQGLSANWDYSAFYDLDRLPPAREILDRVRPRLTENYVYDGIASCLYRWFDLCGIPTIIF